MANEEVYSPNRLKILMIPQDNKGCGFYRMMVPANEIKKQDLADIVVNFGWNWQLVEWAHLIVVQRESDIAAFEAIDQAHSLGKKIIYEIDDYLQGISPLNPAFDFWSPMGPNLGRALKIMQKCDAMQVSTPRLRNEYALWNPVIEVLPNYLDKTLWDTPAWTATHWDNYYKKKNDGIIRIGWAGAGCYDIETEILTENGFKFFRDLNSKEKVATLNPQNNNIEYHKPTKYIEYQYKGKMFNIEMQQVSLCVTPNHNMYRARKGALKNNLKYNLVRAEELKEKSFYLKKDGIWKGIEQEYFTLPKVSYKKGSLNGYYKNNKHKTIIKIKQEKKIKMDDWLKFFGFWLAEGWTSKTTFKNLKGERYNLMQVGIAQSKNNGYLQEMKKIMSKYGFEGKYTKDKKQLRFCNNQLWNYLKQFGSASEKFIPKDILSLPPKKLKILLDYYIKGDGHIEKSGKTRAWTSSKKLADNLSEIALKIGWGANIVNRGKNRGGKNHTIRGRVVLGKYDNYQITFLRNTTPSYFKPFIKKQHQKWIDYNNKVYCIEVKNHVILVRRRGKSIWCGNSHYHDLQLIEEVITKICQKYPNVHFCMMGYFGESNQGKNLFQDIPGSTSICPHCKQAGQLEKIPGIDLLYYPSKLKECAFDIAVAPIIETGFNQSKSDLKIKEYAALGLPVVASNITPYKESVMEGYTGFLASTGKEWFDYLELLIKDEALRKRLGKNNYLWYSQNTIDKHIHEWIQFYQRLVSFKSKW